MGSRARKRVYSNAFQPSDDPYRKVLRSITGPAASPRSSYTPTVLFGFNKKNKIPFLDTETDEKHLHGYLARMRPLLDTQPFEGHSDGPYMFEDFKEGGKSIPLSQLGQLHIDSSPFDFYSDLDSSSPLDGVPGSCSHTEPVIFEDSDAVFVQPDHHEYNATPNALQFKDLSLYGAPETLFPTLPPSPTAASRTSVFIVESHSVQHCFTCLHPEDIVVSFDKGQRVMKINKYLLSHESRFFAPMLDGLCVDGYTRCIRLRDDFPHAVTAMIQFMENGIYAFNSAMRIQYPNITLIDLHVHAYVVGTNIGRMVLSMDVVHIDNSSNSKSSGTAWAVLNSFLDSIVLIWRNTPHRGDALRHAVLELLKPKIHQLLRIKFFQTLMLDMVGFGNDVVGSLADDGFDVKAFPVMAGQLEKAGVRFGVA